MVTIFTSVYNRAYIIEQLYESLKRQTEKNFEWIIVNDGSTDDLQNMVMQWKTEKNEFDIVYLYVPNGGKHRAINIGTRMAEGDAFFIVDSDDYLADDAIAFINSEFKKIEDKYEFAGISGLKCSYVDGSVIGGQPWFLDYVDATNLERGIYGLLGDKAEVYKTKILRENPFPEIGNEKFLSEGIIWNKIAYQGYKLRWFNKKIYYCEYIKDGLTRNLLDVLKENPRGWAKNIIAEEKYFNIDIKNAFNKKYNFYEVMHNLLGLDELCEILEITKKEYLMFEKKWNEILFTIKNVFELNKISTLAIYGFGIYAQRFMLYLKELSINVEYVIDKNYSEVNFQPAFNIEMDLPQIDSICITIKNNVYEIQKKLKKKMSNTYIWSLKDLNGIIE